jgi:hypothetical protein
MLPLEIDLTPDERDAFLDRMAGEVARRRLEAPVILALEMHRPLMFLGSQALVVFTPMLAPAFGLENLQRLCRLMEDRQNLDRFIDRIEEQAARREDPNPERARTGVPEPRA